MSAFRILSGGMIKKINEGTAKLAALEALKQWSLVPMKNLSTVLIAEEDSKASIYFSTRVLLDELGIQYKVHQQSVEFRGEI